jgi:signal peptidase II
MKILKRIILVTIPLIFLVGCDLGTKKIATEQLRGETSRSYLGGVVQFIYAENSGGMLSIGSHLPETVRVLIFKVFVGILLAILFSILILNENISFSYRIALFFFLSGGLGNLFDRIFNDGKVVDFILLNFFDYHTGIFNVADLYVSLGLLIFILTNILNLNKSRAIRKLAS